jgi:hypothetical protein
MISPFFALHVGFKIRLCFDLISALQETAENVLGPNSRATAYILFYVRDDCE